MVGRDIFLPLGILGVVVKYPSVCGGDPPMERFPCLVTVMTLYWLQRRQQKNILWSSSGVNFLSLIYYHLSVVSSGRMYGNISRSWWIYFSRRSLVWGIIFYFDEDVGGVVSCGLKSLV